MPFTQKFGARSTIEVKYNINRGEAYEVADATLPALVMLGVQGEINGCRQATGITGQMLNSAMEKNKPRGCISYARGHRQLCNTQEGTALAYVYAARETRILNETKLVVLMSSVGIMKKIHIPCEHDKTCMCTEEGQAMCVPMLERQFNREGSLGGHFEHLIKRMGRNRHVYRRQFGNNKFDDSTMVDKDEWTVKGGVRPVYQMTKEDYPDAMPQVHHLRCALSNLILKQEEMTQELLQLE
jgi:hypothetical protein